MPLHDYRCDRCDAVDEAFTPGFALGQPIAPCLCGGKRQRLVSAPRVMSDIQPYQAMGTDIATGKAPMITSRSQHREYLARNGYVEVGTEKLKPATKPAVTDAEIARDVKRAIEQTGARL